MTANFPAHRLVDILSDTATSITLRRDLSATHGAGACWERTVKMPSASLYILGHCMSGRSLAFRHKGDALVKTPDRPNPRRINFIHTSPPGNHQQMDVNALVAYLESSARMNCGLCTHK